MAKPISLVPEESPRTESTILPGIPAHASGHTVSAEDKPYVAVVFDGLKLLAVGADAGHVKHNRILLAGDVGAEDPRLDLQEERHVGDVLAGLCPAILGLPGSLHGRDP
jgi:hypothetical protein